MDSIRRATNAFELLEHAVAQKPSSSPVSIAWQLYAGIVGVVEAGCAVLLTVSAPEAWMIWAVPLLTGASLVTSAFTRYRLLPGIFGVLGTAVCGVPLLLLLYGGMC